MDTETAYTVGAGSNVDVEVIDDSSLDVFRRAVLVKLKQQTDARYESRDRYLLLALTCRICHKLAVMAQKQLYVVVVGHWCVYALYCGNQGSRALIRFRSPSQPHTHDLPK